MITLKPGRYWHYILSPEIYPQQSANMQVLWAEWQKLAVPDYARVLSTEGDGKQDWVLFEVYKDVPWPSGLGKPSFAGPNVESESDVMQSPVVRDPLTDGFFPELGKGVGLGVGLGLALAGGFLLLSRHVRALNSEE